MRRAALLAVLAALTIPAAPALAKPASFNDVEDEVMCVSCNVALNVAESPQAERERALIRRLIAQGDDKAQVKAALVAQYGPNVLALPRSHGFNLAVYLVPIALVAALVAALAMFVPRWRARGRAATASSPSADLSPVDAQRLEEDLARYDV
jgi:cytochrome c-type biogenesis protein CcmH